MRAAAHIREYGGTLEHFWIEAVKDRTDAEYLDAREIPASLVTELATDLNGAVLQAANGRPAQLYVIVPVDGALRISFGAGADWEKAARPERPRISVWMLPCGDLARSSGLLSKNAMAGKATGSAGACQNCRKALVQNGRNKPWEKLSSRIIHARTRSQ
ncbi:MAG: DUF3160 domain-containing protein [Oscillospiraceae bacterium]|jgi:hypothetical protein